MTNHLESMQRDMDILSAGVSMKDAIFNQLKNDWFITDRILWISELVEHICDPSDLAKNLDDSDGSGAIWFDVDGAAYGVMKMIPESEIGEYVIFDEEGYIMDEDWILRNQDLVTVLGAAYRAINGGEKIQHGKN